MPARENKIDRRIKSSAKRRRQALKTEPAAVSVWKMMRAAEGRRKDDSREIWGKQEKIGEKEGLQFAMKHVNLNEIAFRGRHSGCSGGRIRGLGRKRFYRKADTVL